MPEPIVLMRPFVPEKAIAAVADALRSRWIGQGPRVDEFEREFSVRVGGRPAVAVSSCTAALHLGYILAGIGPGDEVIAPLFTCTATNEALLYCGAKIVFADVRRRSLNVDPKAVCEMVTERTKAIVIVHYGGQMVDPCEFSHVGRSIPVIEDCAQALGAHGAGTTGDFACFSFQAVKHVTTGDGGMLVLGASDVDRAKRLRWFGIDRAAKFAGTWENDITELGYKYQLTDISAAMGLAGLAELDWQITYRRSLRDAYGAGLAGVDGISVLDRDPDSACWLMTVLVERREEFRRKLKDAGIESDQVHYRNDRYTIFKEFRGSFPNMDAIDGKYLCLPLHMHLTMADVDRVCEVIRSGW